MSRTPRMRDREPMGAGISALSPDTNDGGVDVRGPIRRRPLRIGVEHPPRPGPECSAVGCRASARKLEVDLSGPRIVHAHGVAGTLY